MTTAVYRDYVIRAGEMVGEFDRMYRDCPDPWAQVAEAYSLANSLLCTIVSGRKVARALEIGCGLGALACRIRPLVTELWAVDISRTAIEDADRRYPGIGFMVRDALSPEWSDWPQKMDLIVISELCWYVLEDLDGMFGRARRLLADNGRLVVMLNFNQSYEYGLAELPSVDSLASRIEDAGFDIRERVEIHAPDKASVRVIIEAEHG